jgi:hypothetical protein
MHWKSTEADGADGADGDSSEYKVSEVVEMVRTCQNLLGQDGIRPGLLLPHVGPNGDRFERQAFMEHYTTYQPWWLLSHGRSVPDSTILPCVVAFRPWWNFKTTAIGSV